MDYRVKDFDGLAFLGQGSSGCAYKKGRKIYKFFGLNPEDSNVISPHPDEIDNLKIDIAVCWLWYKTKNLKIIPPIEEFGKWWVVLPFCPVTKEAQEFGSMMDRVCNGGWIVPSQDKWAQKDWNETHPSDKKRLQEWGDLMKEDVFNILGKYEPNILNLSTSDVRYNNVGELNGKMVPFDWFTTCYSGYGNADRVRNKLLKVYDSIPDKFKLDKDEILDTSRYILER